MSNVIEEIPFLESKTYRCKLISLPYEENDLALYIILPDENHEYAYEINKFSQQLKATDILKMISEAKLRDVTVKIPKMSLTNTMSILEPLKKYSAFIKNKKRTNREKVQDLQRMRRENVRRFGQNERIQAWRAKGRAQNIDNRSQDRSQDTRIKAQQMIFSNRAFKGSLDEIEDKVDEFLKYNDSKTLDNIVLNNAAEGENLIISNLFQEMTFSINEKGTEAAAISGGIIDYFGGSSTFYLTRPFIFFIRHEETTATIFWGTIVDPTQTS